MLQRGVGGLKTKLSFGVLTFQALRYKELEELVADVLPAFRK
jgi:hypothetical protein